MHCYLRRSVIPKVSSWKRNEILPSFCNFRYRNLFDNHSFSTRSQVSNYNKGKQHFLFFTFSKIIFSLTAFLKKNIKKKTAILYSQYFVTLDQSTPWQNNLTFSFLEPLTRLKCKTQTLAYQGFHFKHFRAG